MNEYDGSQIFRTSMKLFSLLINFYDLPPTFINISFNSPFDLGAWDFEDK